eukprot:m.47825 g.47825  ORF g.47825 m.47825 type:complete len:725 (-) comp7362_c0_seq1:871-3045(-)
MSTIAPANRNDTNEAIQAIPHGSSNTCNNNDNKETEAHRLALQKRNLVFHTATNHSIRGNRMWSLQNKRSKVVPFTGTNDNDVEPCSSPSAHINNASLLQRLSIKLGKASVFRRPDNHRVPLSTTMEESKPLNYFIIHPYSTFRWYWDLIMVVMLIFTVVSIPVAIAFFNEGTGKAYFVCSCIIDSLFLLDIFFNFRTGIDSPKSLQVIILDRKRIAQQYIRGWFFIDLISSLPLDYIISACYGVSYDSPSYLKASRALKFIRVAKILTLLRLLRVTRVFRLFRRWEEVINVNTAWIRMFKLVVLMLLMSHWSGCIQFLAAQLANFPEDSWVSVNGLVDSPPSVQYSWALFKALSHMLCIGYGRFPPRSVTEAWFTMFSMVIGATFYAIFIGQISSITLSIDSAGRVYREKIQEAAEYLRARKVPTKIKQRVFDYYEYRWAQRKYFDEKQLLEEISPGLRAEIIKHNCEPLVQSLPFLRNASLDLIEAITTRVTFHVVMPGEIIIKGNTFGSQMFLLQYGMVEVILPSGEIVAQLEDGSYFGEMSLLHKTKRAATVRAKSACKLYVLSQEALREVESEFPSLRRELELTAEMRLEQLKVIQGEQTSENDELWGENGNDTGSHLMASKQRNKRIDDEDYNDEDYRADKDYYEGEDKKVENEDDLFYAQENSSCKVSVLSSKTPNSFCLANGKAALSYGGGKKSSVMHTRNAWKHCNPPNSNALKK